MTSGFRNLLDGIDVPLDDAGIGPTCAELLQRIKQHRAQCEVELAAPIALLQALRSRCKHPGAKTYTDMSGVLCMYCSICGLDN